MVRIGAQWNRRESWRRPARDPETDRVVNWRLHAASSGGLLLEQGSHAFDLANWFLEARPEAVAGFGGIRQWRDWRDVDDTVQVVLRYPEGVQLAFDATLASSYGDDREQLAGTAGTMLLLRQSKGLLFKESDSVTAGWEAFARQELLDERRGIVLDPEATRYVGDAAPGGPDAGGADFYAELAAFADAVRGGPPPLCGAREGLEAAVIALLALEAVASGATLDIPAAAFEIG
jgi:predicted dehydrogenase